MLGVEAMRSVGACSDMTCGGPEAVECPDRRGEARCLTMSHMRTRPSRPLCLTAILAAALLIGAGSAHSRSGAATSSDYEAVIAALESLPATCSATSHRSHGAHKKCCFRTWPADEAAAAALGMMIIYPTPESGEEAAVTFSDAEGLYRLDDSGRWRALLRPEDNQLIRYGAEGAADVYIEYDGPPHAVTVTHAERSGPDAPAKPVRSYVGSCAAHGPWWWGSQSMEAVLSRLARDGELPVDCPEVEGPYGERISGVGFQTGFRRADGATVFCEAPGATITEQQLKIAVQGDLSRMIPAPLVLPRAWGCTRADTPYGDFLVPGGEQSYTLSQALPIGTIQTTDGVQIQWPERWERPPPDGSQKRAPFQGQGTVTITDAEGQTAVDVRIGVHEDGLLKLQGHGRYRRDSLSGAPEASGHFFSGFRDGAWTRTAADGSTSSAVFESASKPEGMWSYLYAAHPIGCAEAQRQMQQAAARISSPAYADRLLARIDVAKASLPGELARIERGGVDAAEQRFIGCVRQTISQLTAFHNDLNMVSQSAPAPTGACRSGLDLAMVAIDAPGADCVDWAARALGSSLSSSAQTYLRTQTRYQELSCRCDRIGDADDAEQWLQEVADRAADRWPRPAGASQ